MNRETEQGLQQYPEGLPSYSEANWRKFLDLVPGISFLQPKDWQYTLDSILMTWQAKDVQARMEQLAEAIKLPNIPKNEVRDAQTLIDEGKDSWKIFVEGVNAVVAGQRPHWKKIEEVSEAASNFSRARGRGEDDQAIALLTAWSEMPEGTDPKFLRMAAAQHAIDEVSDLGLHRTYRYTAAEVGEDVEELSTQDSLLVETSELEGAFKGKNWTAKEKKEANKKYLALRKLILNGDNSVSEDVADDLERLWNAASEGTGTVKYSALHFLQLGEDIYKAMEEGGAFDVDLIELDEEEKELEEEEEDPENSEE